MVYESHARYVATIQRYKTWKSKLFRGQSMWTNMEISCNDECHSEWDRILDNMIFLFREMNEETCQKKNPYQKEHDNILQEFEEKYGLFGEKLEEGKMNKFGRVLHFPSEIPEYKDIEKKYYAEEKALRQYREDCKNEALELFSKWFYSLWD